MFKIRAVESALALIAITACVSSAMETPTPGLFQTTGTVTVTGRVTTSDGKPVPNARVYVPGTNEATRTDANGNYGVFLCARRCSLPQPGAALSIWSLPTLGPVNAKEIHQPSSPGPACSSTCLHPPIQPLTGEPCQTDLSLSPLSSSLPPVPPRPSRKPLPIRNAPPRDHRVTARGPVATRAAEAEMPPCSHVLTTV
jgi:hypothetical protein